MISVFSSNFPGTRLDSKSSAPEEANHESSGLQLGFMKCSESDKVKLGFNANLMMTSKEIKYTFQYIYYSNSVGTWLLSDPIYQSPRMLCCFHK